jgi:hypothetical protein
MFWASWIRIRNLFEPIRIQILPSTSKKIKKNLNFFCFVTSLWLFIFEKWCKCTFKSKRNKHWIQILLFLSWALKMPTNNKFVFLFITFKGTFTSVFQDKKSWRCHIIVEIKVFLTFLLEDGRIWIRTNNDKSGRPKNILSSVEDPGSGTFLTPGSGNQDGKKIRSGSGI